MFFSIVIPVYNRPDEIRELLESLRAQEATNFEVIVMDDGSENTCEPIVKSFEKDLQITYQWIENIGQGFARNRGAALAKGDYLIFFDSDCIIPPDYLVTVEAAIQGRALDAFGGPDAAHKNFSVLQKAMDYAMTSFWTTGGIRGKLQDPSKYQARGYNMGFSREVFEKTKGFIDPNQGEDIELSIRIKKAGFKLELIADAFVYHKRKAGVIAFVRQGFSFGRNRVNVSTYHPEAIKLVHLLPLAFLLFCLSMPMIAWLFPMLFYLQLFVFIAWLGLIFYGATIQYDTPLVGLLALPLSIAQLSAYAVGLAWAWLRKS
ncbi:glycosyltransferase [Mongoliitalea daihaiensis]|uniref:glycosyltransferase n=1 Tax=Mongoliitalea daihaiensis TaxID=2782006 RepID=UPI001F2176CD|nr:glycosyltransferase [Mongoliitalea daihaiensis]UJP66627.1 glycosyltransferase [Mongoliitalea daihaiensis]